MTEPIFALGDIHGQLDALEQALAWVEADGGPDAEIVFLGDLVDRGPSSKAVIERLREGVAAGRRWTVLMGNHDRMFARFLHDTTLNDARIKSGIGWLHPRLGGCETLSSYGVRVGDGQSPAEIRAAALAAVPAAHRTFLESLPLYRQSGELLFVHAGIRPGVALGDQAEDDLLWIREDFLADPRPHPWLVVHGHTALEMPFHYGNRVNLDGGAGYGRPIFPAVFEGTECWLLDGSGRLSLVP